MHVYLIFKQVLLNKVLSEGALAELANPVSGVVILLLVSLRQTYNASTETRNQTEAYVSILDSLQSLKSGGREQASSGPTSRMYSTALQVILKGLITWIIETSNKSLFISNLLNLRLS